MSDSLCYNVIILQRIPSMSEKTTEKIYYDPISVAQRTSQKMYLVDARDKSAILLHLLKGYQNLHAVVITKTKRDADALSAYLNKQEIKTVSIHGSKRAAENETSAQTFNKDECSVLITTDVILQSLTLTYVSHLISYDLPTEPEHYLNRMGTLNEQGEAIALVSENQEVVLLDIERVMRQEILEEAIEGFVPIPKTDLEPQAVKEKKKKPRHRKQKRKSES